MGMLLQPLVWCTIGYEADPFQGLSSEEIRRIRRKSNMHVTPMDTSNISAADIDIRGVSASVSDSGGTNATSVGPNAYDDDGVSSDEDEQKPEKPFRSKTLVSWIRYATTYREPTISDRLKLVNSNEIAMFQFVTTVFNILLIPCFSVAVTNLQCFAGLLTAPTTITSSVSYYLCELTELGTSVRHNLPGTNYALQILCSAYDNSSLQTISATYQLPFVYGNQCMAEIMSAYVPVLMLNYFITGFFMPLLYLLVMHFCNNRVEVVKETLHKSERLRAERKLEQQRSTRDALKVKVKTKTAVTEETPGSSNGNGNGNGTDGGIVVDIDSTLSGPVTRTETESESGSESFIREQEPLSLCNCFSRAYLATAGLLERFQWWVIRQLMTSTLRYWPIEVVMQNRRESKFTQKMDFSGSRSLLFSTVGAIVHLLTYGLAYSPLAILISMSVVTTTAQYQYIIQMHVNQLYKMEDNLTCLRIYRRKITADCRGLWKVFGHYIDVILVIAGLFNALYLGDTAINIDVIWRIAGIIPCVYWFIKRVWVRVDMESYKDVTIRATRAISRRVQAMYGVSDMAGEDWALPVQSNVNHTKTSNTSSGGGGGSSCGGSTTGGETLNPLVTGI